MIYTEIDNHGAILNQTFLQSSVAMIGLGHSLSQVGYNLAKLGIKEFHLYDGDSVSNSNLYGTLYTPDHVNYEKTRTYANILRSASPSVSAILTSYRYVDFESKLLPADFYLVGVDSGNARIAIADAIIRCLNDVPKHFIREHTYLIDIRFKFDCFIGIIINVTDDEAWKIYFEDLFDLKDIEDTHGCNARSHPLAISLAGATVPEIMLRLCKGDPKSVVRFGGNINNLSSVVI